MVAALLLATPACASRNDVIPECSNTTEGLFVLMAQAVPTATKLPCVATFPDGWGYAGFSIKNGAARFWLHYGTTTNALEVDLSSTCDAAGATSAVPSSDEIDTVVSVRAAGSDLPPVARFLRFEGGCVAYRYHFPPGASASLAEQANTAVAFIPRSEIVRSVHEEFGLSLCGAGAPPCPG
jgi:hypothetical protein